MLRFILISFSFFFLIAKSHAVIRFPHEKLTFTLVDSTTGIATSCQHKLLTNNSPAPPPPWWVVTCDDRTYTVDIWMDKYKSADQLSNIFLLFHAKESLSSSGEKSVRFDTQTTLMKMDNSQQVRVIRSTIDVRNGLADLEVEVSL